MLKYRDLKAYHAFYVMAVLFVLSCFFSGDLVFFPLACCMFCLGISGQLKEQGRLPVADAKAQGDPSSHDDHFA